MVTKLMNIPENEYKLKQAANYNHPHIINENLTPNKNIEIWPTNEPQGIPKNIKIVIEKNVL